MDHNLLKVEDEQVEVEDEQVEVEDVMVVEVHKLLLVLVEYNHPLVKDEEVVVET